MGASDTEAELPYLFIVPMMWICRIYLEYEQIFLRITVSLDPIARLADHKL